MNSVDILIRALGTDQAAQHIAGVQNALSSMRAAVSGIAGAFAAAGITEQLRQMWAAAEESRVAQFQLRAALEASGAASQGFAEALMDQANALQGLTGVSDETVMSVQRVLLAMGATTDQVQQLTPLVLDVAAAMGTDATTAARQLGGALDGQEVSLGRLNIKVKSVEELVQVLSQRFRGQSQALMEAKGPMASIQIAAGELQEKLGSLMAWSAAPFIAELDRVASTLERIASVDIGQGTLAVLTMLTQNLPGVQGLRAMGGLAGGLEAGIRSASSLASLWNLPQTLNGKIGASPSEQRRGGAAGFDPEQASIEAERARQIAAARELMQVEAELNNNYAFRRQLIEGDPTMSEPDRRKMLLGVLREELPVRQHLEVLRRSEFERALQSDPDKSLQTTIDAEGSLLDVQSKRLRTEQEIQAIEQSGTFNGQLAKRLEDLQAQYGNLAVAMANVAVDTVENSVRGLAGALTAVITGTKTAAQAFGEFGRALLSNFIESILTAVLYAKVALPILSALGVATAGASFGSGAAVVGMGLAFGLAAGGAAANGKKLAEGGYTGDGSKWEVAGQVHRGEWVVPAWRVSEIGLPALNAMTYGDNSPSNGGQVMVRNIIVDDRRSAERLARDPRYKNMIVDLINERIG